MNQLIDVASIMGLDVVEDVGCNFGHLILHRLTKVSS